MFIKVVKIILANNKNSATYMQACYFLTERYIKSSENNINNKKSAELIFNRLIVFVTYIHACMFFLIERYIKSSQNNTNNKKSAELPFIRVVKIILTIKSLLHTCMHVFF